MANTDGRPFAPTQIRVDEHGEIQVFGPEVTVGLSRPRPHRGRLHRRRLVPHRRLGPNRCRRLAHRHRATGAEDHPGGENIDAAEVEAILESHPAVSQAVVLGEPDDRLGERVAAFLVADGRFDLDECRRWFSESGAARFMTPERIIPLADIPKMASGKPDKTELARLLEDSTR